VEVIPVRSIARRAPVHRRVAAVLLAALVLGGCGRTTDDTVATSEPEPATVEVDVFFTNDQLGDPCGEVFPVTRTVDADDPVRGALEALLAGPTDAERADGYGGWFSDDTAELLLDVEVVEGVAHVTFADLRPVIPNASTSCGSAALLAQLDQTLLAFDDVDDTRYALADQAAFYGWLQLADPDAPPPLEEPEAAPDHPAPDDQPTDEDEAADTDTSTHDDGPEPAGRGAWRWGDPTATGTGVAVNCCDIPHEGPPSPAGPLPETDWPADGFYAVGITYLEGPGSSVRLVIGRWERCEVLPDGVCPDHWPPDALEVDRDASITREVPLDVFDVAIVPMRSLQDEEAESRGVLYGTAPAFAALLHDELGPAFRTWVIEPYQAGMANGDDDVGQLIADVSRTIEEELRSRSSDPEFPFGTLADDDPAEGQLGYRGPLGSLLVIDTFMPERLPEEFYHWRFPSLEIRDGRPILHVTADGYYG
jgi:hypothetical protein